MANKNKHDFNNSSRDIWRSRLLKTSAAVLGVLALAGCGKEVVGQAVPEKQTSSISTELTPSAPSTSEQTPDRGLSILEDKPSDVNDESWCGYKASQAAIHNLLEEIEEDGSRTGIYKASDNQNYFVVQKTDIGYTFSNMELHPAHDLVLRGDLSVMSTADTPLSALDTASFTDDQGGTSGIRLSVAAWRLGGYAEGDPRGGGTSDGVGDICGVAQEIVDATH